MGDQVGEVIPPSSQNKLLKYTNSKVFTNTITINSGHKISSSPPDQSRNLAPENLQREAEALMTSKVMTRVFPW